MTEKLSPIQAELLSRADSIFAAISATVGKATDFAAVQIPEIAIQYVAYGRAYLTILFLFFFSTFITGLYLIIRVAIMNCYKAPNPYGSTWANSRDGAMVCGLMLTIISFFSISMNLSKVMMVWFAPKIWLITELVKLAK